MMKMMIATERLTKHFEAFVAVRQVNLQVAQGELLALLGPNGAGKTTTVRMLSSVLRPTAGRATINGYDVVADAEAVRRSVGVLTEQPGLYARMTGLEYLQFYGRLYGLGAEFARQRSSNLFARFDMAGAETRRLGTYSKGMRQKVGLIRAMLHDPAVLLLDEPTSAMDPHSAKLVRDAIRELQQDNRAIILCTHNLAEAESLADRIAIINQGEIVASGSPDELKHKLLGPAVLELTLDQPLDGHRPELEHIVDIKQVDNHIIRYRATNPATQNPQLVHTLSGLGLGVISLTEISQSLEEVYLNVVNGPPARPETGDRGPQTADGGPQAILDIKR
jgi:ABC-2 type transport system ATP-binding protein